MISPEGQSTLTQLEAKRSRNNHEIPDEERKKKSHDSRSPEVFRPWLLSWSPISVLAASLMTLAPSPRLQLPVTPSYEPSPAPDCKPSRNTWKKKNKNTKRKNV